MEFGYVARVLCNEAEKSLLRSRRFFTAGSGVVECGERVWGYTGEFIVGFFMSSGR